MADASCGLTDDIWQKLDSFRQQLLQEERITQLRQQCSVDVELSTKIADGTDLGSGGGTKAAQTYASRSPGIALALDVAEDRNTCLSQSQERQQILQKIEGIINNIISSIADGEPPTLEYRRRTSWDDVRFAEGRGLEIVADGPMTSVRFDSSISTNKFASMVNLLSAVYKLLETDTYCTKRDLYYQDPKLYNSQACVDRLIDDISCMLRVPRWRLHVLATSKGCLAGALCYTEMDGSFVDCSQTNTGLLVPSHVEGLTNMHSNAKFVLIVEKDATFQRLLDDGVCRKLAPCIIITGKGFPDVNTRLMVRRLWEEFHLPTLALVDADPHGMEILAVYKYGSRALSFEASNLTVPIIRWLGVWPSDIKRFHIPSEALIPLTALDKNKARELMGRKYISAHPAWKKELEQMVEMGVKAEIQCLQSVSSRFLSDVYLPNKLRFGGWI